MQATLLEKHEVTAENPRIGTLALTTQIVVRYLSGNTATLAMDLPSIIRSVHFALTEPNVPPPEANVRRLRASKRTISRSITPDALISFIDKKPYKTLKRHLRRHGLDMASYREKYGLPVDYPSVAANYSAAHSEMAKRLGLGARRRSSGAPPSAAVARSSQTAAVGA